MVRGRGWCILRGRGCGRSRGRGRGRPDPEVGLEPTPNRIRSQRRRRDNRGERRTWRCGGPQSRRSAEHGPRPPGSGGGAGAEPGPEPPRDDSGGGGPHAAEDHSRPGPQSRSSASARLWRWGRTGASGLKAETKLMNQLEEIFIEPGGKINLHKWH